jgi:hypothetical protein
VLQASHTRRGAAARRPPPRPPTKKKKKGEEIKIRKKEKAQKSKSPLCMQYNVTNNKWRAWQEQKGAVLGRFEEPTLL